MRPKKDPDIRRERFVEVASELFLRNGYDGVSVKAVLDAVGERSASPSVFYYYFANKEELYRAVVENEANKYVAGFERAFSVGGSLDGQAAELVEVMKRSLAAHRNLTFGALDGANRGFLLDMKEQVTDSLAKLWEDFLLRSGLSGGRDVKRLSLFLSGGIAAAVTDYMSNKLRSEEEERKLLGEIVSFAVSVLGFGDMEMSMKNMDERRD